MTQINWWARVESNHRCILRHGFTVRCLRHSAHLPNMLAEWTGLEPATLGVTSRYSSQLNYHSKNKHFAPAAGLEPATHGLTVRCSTNWATLEQSAQWLLYIKFCKRTRSDCRHFIIRVSMITAETLISSFFTNNREIPTTNSILLQKSGIILNHCCTKQPNDNPNNKFHNIINHCHSIPKQDRWCIPYANNFVLRSLHYLSY